MVEAAGEGRRPLDYVVREVQARLGPALHRWAGGAGRGGVEAEWSCMSCILWWNSSKQLWGKRNAISLATPALGCHEASNSWLAAAAADHDMGPLPPGCRRALVEEVKARFEVAAESADSSSVRARLAQVGRLGCRWRWGRQGFGAH